MKKWLLPIILVLLATGCTTSRYSQIEQAGAAINIDSDSNDAVDVGYGGTNATTAAGARSNLGAASADDLTNHEGDTLNPHSTTASQVGAIPTSGQADVTTELDLTDGKLEPPSGSSLPASCNPFQAFILTSGTTGQLWYVCETTNNWVLQSSGGTDTTSLRYLIENCSSSEPGTTYAGMPACSDGDSWQPGGTDQGTDDWLVFRNGADDGWYGVLNLTTGKHIYTSLQTVHCFAVGDETTALTTGTSKKTFRMPYTMTVTEVRASVGTAPTGAPLIFDVNESGASIFSTNLTIDADEKTSTTAATAAVLDDTTLTDDAEITIDIDQIGSSVAGAGPKMCFIGTR